uniref:Ig-like domain-containing protein n=1 Tax=Vombatus ursinus TaxID=29139 RepID=A0A4X2LMX4_VOMUR
LKRINPLFLLFLSGDSTAKEVIQPQPATSGQEREAVTLNCKYDISDFNYALFWYKQPPGGGLIFLIRQESYNSQNAREDRYSVNFQKSDKSINLTISALQLGDSAMYFCALYEPTVISEIGGEVQKQEGIWGKHESLARKEEGFSPQLWILRRK